MTAGNVLILDDDEAVVDALTIRLEMEGYHVRGFPDPASFLKADHIEAADCLLLDLRMPGSDGLTVLREMRQVAPALRIIMMTGHGDVEVAVAALKEGATDFLEKPFADRRLLGAVEQAVNAKRALHVEPGGDDGARAHLESLTPRETDVFHELVAGHPNKIIAHHLGCSQRTVEIHRSRVMSKMQAKSLADLVRMAVQHKLTLGT